MKVGDTVARCSKGAGGRTGQVLELDGYRARIHWTKKAKGEPMSVKSWERFDGLMVLKTAEKPVEPLNWEKLITDWQQTIGLKVEAIRTATIPADDDIELTLVHFTTGQFLIQQDQSYYTTTCGLIYELTEEIKTALS